MRVRPSWPVAVGAYVGYNLIIFATWGAVGANYVDLVSEDVALKSLILPLSLGAIFTAITVTALGWWRPALWERFPARPGWALFIILAVMLGLCAANGAATHWTTLSTAHWLALIAAGVLVGFNEELIVRGILLTGFRGSMPREISVWFWSTFLFGAMHVPNAFFGLPLYAGLLQGVAAFLAGTALYVLRRVSGTLMLPMVMHGLWDFSSFGVQASGGHSPVAIIFQVGTYLLALAAVIAVLRKGDHGPLAEVAP